MKCRQPIASGHKRPLIRLIHTPSNTDLLIRPRHCKRILQKYEGTRTGRQEIYAELLEEAEGALWNRAQLEKLRSKHAFYRQLMEGDTWRGALSELEEILDGPPSVFRKKYAAALVLKTHNFPWKKR